MARTLEQIQASLIANIIATPELASANSNSTRALWRLWTYVWAKSILTLEQFIDLFKLENEIKLIQATPGTGNWVKKKVLDFQYSSSNPQVIQLVDLVPIYAVPDNSLKIITRCSVNTTVAGQVLVKVAKSDPPIQLTNLELSSLQSYVSTVGIEGINYTCLSSPSDKLMINADVYYDGQYSSVIQNAVTNAINNFLATIPFNGVIKVLDIEIAIRNILGVNDVLIKNISIRDDGTPFSGATYLVQNQQVISRIFNLIAGYVIPETTSGQTLTETLNYIAV